MASDGSRTVNSNSSLSQFHFSPLRASHGGLYICQATVGGVVAEGTTSVEVNRKLTGHYMHPCVGPRKRN